MATFDPITDIKTTQTRILPAYRMLAQSLQAYRNCIERSDEEWEVRHRDNIEQIVKNTAPSGSGIDNGTSCDVDDCTDNKLVFSFSFHHMNDYGYYTKWTEHKAIAKPCFDGIDLKITGQNKSDIKEYLHEVYYSWLTSDIEHVYDKIDGINQFRLHGWRLFGS